ncbi:hypothetical protein JQX13_09195 [Archangium violaceum]|uniref:hypothetical protein n=1 Tax=Archangium violaceum TaxID=83451 RepID=UPI00193B9BF0|nr:hypothetical protein [Archangium violaceum]QRK10247.1 hypothetical protein JQX13_09195 [Archangium violaceum]
MKRLLSAVLTLVPILPLPTLAAPAMRVTLPEKTKNACIRKVARLSSTQKYDAALTELSTPECTENLGTEEQLWVELMRGVLYQRLEKLPEAEAAHCRALKLEPLASLPLSNPTEEQDGLFEMLRIDCPERERLEAEKAAAAAAAAEAAAKQAALAEATPPPAAEAPPPVDSEPAAEPPLFGAFQLYAGIHSEADFQRALPLPLLGVSAQGTVHLIHGLRGGVGLTALSSSVGTSTPVFLLMADVRLAYPLVEPNPRYGLQVYATGGPLLYTMDSGGGGARAGLGLALDVSRVRVSLGGAYEWRDHYRLGYQAPMAWLEVGWRLF